MNGFQFVGSLVGLERPTEAEMVQAAMKGDGPPSWNCRVECRDHRGDMLAVAGFFDGFDSAGQQTPLLQKLRAWFGEPTERGEVRVENAPKVRIYFSQGISKNRKMWYRITEAELIESPAEAAPPSRNGKQAQPVSA